MPAGYRRSATPSTTSYASIRKATTTPRRSTPCRTPSHGSGRIAASSRRGRFGSPDGSRALRPVVLIHPTFHPTEGGRPVAKMMTKSATLGHLAQKTNLSKKQIAEVFDETLNLACKEAKNGFVLPGFGKLDFAASPWPAVQSTPAFAWGAHAVAGGVERLVAAVVAERSERAAMLYGPVI